VTRATVYRRYPTKADMVTAAVCTMAGPDEPCECPDLRTTLVELLRGFHAAVGPSDGISSPRRSTSSGTTIRRCSSRSARRSPSPAG